MTLLSGLTGALSNTNSDLRRVFDIETLARMVCSPGSGGEFQLVEEHPRRRVLFLSPADLTGPVELWISPSPECLYVIDAHFSDDWSVGFVIDQKTGKQTTLLRGRFRPEEFAAHLALLGEAYTSKFTGVWPLLVVEASNAEFIDALLGTRYPVDFMYKQRALAGDREGQIGFEITPATRPLLISAVRDALMGIGTPLSIRNEVALEEFKSFVIRPDGTPGAAPGRLDGCVWAAALACYGVREVRKHAVAARRAAELADRLGRRRRPDYDD